MGSSSACDTILGECLGSISAFRLRTCWNFMNTYSLVTSLPMHTVFRHTLRCGLMLRNAIFIPGAAAWQFGAVQGAPWQWTVPQRGDRGVSQLSGSDMLTLYTSSSHHWPPAHCPSPPS